MPSLRILIILGPLGAGTLLRIASAGALRGGAGGVAGAPVVGGGGSLTAAAAATTGGGASARSGPPRPRGGGGRPRGPGAPGAETDQEPDHEQRAGAGPERKAGAWLLEHAAQRRLGLASRTDVGRVGGRDAEEIRRPQIPGGRGGRPCADGVEVDDFGIFGAHALHRCKRASIARRPLAMEKAFQTPIRSHQGCERWGHGGGTVGGVCSGWIADHSTAIGLGPEA